MALSQAQLISAAMFGADLGSHATYFENAAKTGKYYIGNPADKVEIHTLLGLELPLKGAAAVAAVLKHEQQYLADTSEGKTPVLTNEAILAQVEATLGADYAASLQASLASGTDLYAALATVAAAAETAGVNPVLTTTLDDVAAGTAVDGIPGETFVLTSGADIIRAKTAADEAQPQLDEEGNPVLDADGKPVMVQPELPAGTHFNTANNDVFVGAITSRSSTTTFSTEDKLDGGAGTDTLKLSIDKDFRGYNEGEVGIENIERLELTNEGSRKRKFDVKNIDGLENITLNMEKADIELAGLSNVDATIEARNLAKGNLKLGYTTGAVSSASDDTLNLVLNNIGTASVGVFGCKDYKAAETITLDATGLGQLNNLNINSMGTLNLFNVGTVGIDSITVTGAATTSLSNVSTQLNVFDASAATGKVTADLTNAATQNLKDIAAGTNDDNISVSATGLATTVKLNGGEGNNTLTIAADADKTIKPTMENFQTLAVTGTNKLTVSGEGVDGLTTVNYGMTGELLLANLDNTELTLNLGNASAGKATYTGEGQLTINTTAGNANPVDCDGKLVIGTPTASSANVVASEAEVVDFNVKAFSTYNGTITAGKAEEVTLNIESALYNDTHAAGTKGTEATSFTGTLQANEASIVNINAEGKLGGIVTASKAEELNLNVAAHDNSLELNASEAQALTLTVEGDKAFAIAGATANLNKVEELNVTTSGKAALNVEMKKLASATITGTGNFVIGAIAPVGGTPAEFTFDVGTAADIVADTGKGISFGGQAIYTSTGVVSADTAIATAIAAGPNVTVAGVEYAFTAVGTAVTATAQTAAVIATAPTLTSDLTTPPASLTVTNSVPGVDPVDTFTATNVGGEAQDVTLDASDLLGDFAVKVVGYKDEDAKDANGTADVFGSGVGKNDITVIGRQTVEITGGVQDDSITVQGAVYDADGLLVAAGIATAMVTGGLGEDTFTFTASSKLVATITDFEVGVDVLTGGTAVTFANRAAVVTALETTFDVVTSVNTSAVITEIEIDLDGTGTSAAVKGFAYDGDVYVANGDANVLVQLTGLSEADYTVATSNSFA